MMLKQLAVLIMAVGLVIYVILATTSGQTSKPAWTYSCSVFIKGVIDTLTGVSQNQAAEAKVIYVPGAVQGYCVVFEK